MVIGKFEFLVILRFTCMSHGMYMVHFFQSLKESEKSFFLLMQYPFPNNLSKENIFFLCSVLLLKGVVSALQNLTIEKKLLLQKYYIC